MKRILFFLAVVLWAGTAVCATRAQEKSAMDYLGEGSAYYLKGDYKKAIPPYQKALDLEKEKQTLDKDLWKVLIDNLGMSYGITGDLKRAKETFEYGISKDPEYPLFYYNMACTYGEMDNVDKAIDYLKLAFERKANVIPGEEMPDPATDSSFERFMKNEKFLKALKEIKKK
jgi:tetratricopeptide (TPR) repeat protein